MIKDTSSVLSTLDIKTLSALIQQGDISSQQLVESCLSQTEQYDPQLNVFTHLDSDHALQQASELDALYKQGQWLGPLHGIPVAVKDNYLVSGMSATACSATRNKQIGTRDATAVAQLRAAGALILGKTNMHEWAYGATNEISREGSVKNPWDQQRISGGSSGGSAAALAAGLVPAAMGSDTGGSIRIPAAACGVCGLKPSFGQVSVSGVLPLSWSLDVAGPMARSAADLALLFDAVKQAKSNDTNSSASTNSHHFPNGLSGLQVATLSGERLEYSDEVGHSFKQALDVLSDQGATVHGIELDNMSEGFAAWDTILHVEASTYHSTALQKNADLFSDNVRNHLEAGRYIPGTHYLKAQQYRRLFNRRIMQIMAQHHVIAIPTLPITAPLSGSETVSFAGVEITPQDSMTYLAWLANFTGLPALSIPCGKGQNGMPVGLSLIGPAGSDEMLLRLGVAVQQVSAWHTEKPDLPHGV